MPIGCKGEGYLRPLDAGDVDLLLVFKQDATGGGTAEGGSGSV